MKILLTGANGYIGKRLLPVLVEQGHHLVCCVRDAKRFRYPQSLAKNISIVELDFLKEETLKRIPNDIDAAYYLIHSMSANKDYEEMEARSALNFSNAVSGTNAAQVIYLSGIINDQKLSKHLSSRKNVEKVLSQGTYHLTTLRAGIIVGSGSASFEIIRDLVEKLPVMITPKWLNTRCQPIAIRDVIAFLVKTLNYQAAYDRSYDIGGSDILTYKEMLLIFADVRKLKRFIFTIPVMTPRLSSYWLYFVTATTYYLAVNLVDSMKVEVVCRKNDLAQELNIQPLSYREAIIRAFEKIEQNAIVSSWKDSLISGSIHLLPTEMVQTPVHGCFKDQRIVSVKDPEQTIDNIWSIGGKTGWYYGNVLWQIRGFIDKLFGGVGLRRGRTNSTQLHAGDSLDFWRVLLADRSEKRLVLMAEMKLPGEAWLEFRLVNDKYLHQQATFRPRGLSGRIYWYAMAPFHHFLFNGMIRKIASR
jgi:uncharacterized protein YbjT (DUF2867 family)